MEPQPTAPPKPEDYTSTFHGGFLTFEQLLEAYREGLIGKKEFRNYVAELDSTFKSVRDPHVDGNIDAIARLIQEQQALEEETLREERQRRAERLAE